MSFLTSLIPRSALNGARSGIGALSLAARTLVRAVSTGDIALICAIAFAAVTLVGECEKVVLNIGSLFGGDPFKGSRRLWQGIQTTYPADVAAAQTMVLNLSTIEVAIVHGVEAEVVALADTALGKVLAKL